MLQKIVIFPVRSITVIGNRHLSDSDVSRMSKLRKGTSIFSVSSRAVVRRLEKSPWIKKVTLRKEMPDKILIKIKEAVPSALVEKKGGHYLVRSDGEILEKQESGERFLPVIKGDFSDRNVLQEAMPVH